MSAILTSIVILSTFCLVCQSQVYVTKHNTLRQQISLGLVPTQPRATNLFNLAYDAQLEQEAAKISATCKFAHVTVYDSRFYVGQNLYWSSNYITWDVVIQAWFDEHLSYVYPAGFSSQTGHYTQVVWADTIYVGCAYTNCTGFSIYVCNYGPGGNVNNLPPYSV